MAAGHGGRFAAEDNAMRFSLILGLTLISTAARAQDVPGIEICTVDKTWERRTSCLQSNVDFLVKTINKLSLDHQQKIDALGRQNEALRGSVAVLQKTVGDLQNAQAKPAAAAPAKDAPVKKE